MVIVDTFFTDTCNPNTPGLSVLPAGSWPSCVLPPCLLSPTRNCLNRLAAMAILTPVSRTEESQPEAFRTYSLILAGIGGFLPLLLTLMAYNVLGLVLHNQGTTTAQKLHTAGDQQCGSPCLLLCALPPHTSGPCRCQVVLDGWLPLLLQ